MLASIGRFFRRLQRSKSGNALMLVAMGMPALIGGSGLAIDTAQWYMWKREMQYAVDQGALAGAWARTATATASSYTTRATQEYQLNVQKVDDIDAAPTVTLVNYGTGTANAVMVSASATKTLPFSSFLTSRGVTVAVSATASVVPAVAGTSTSSTVAGVSACLVALDPTASGAFTIGGTASGAVPCGGATLSSDSTAAIQENGNPGVQFGLLAARGGIEGSLLNNVGNVASRLQPNQTGLTDPYGTIATPTGSGVAQTYSCPAVVASSTKATTSPTTYTSYAYVIASTSGNAITYATNGTNTYSGTMSSPYRRAATSAAGTVTNGASVATGTSEGSYTDSATTYTDMGATTTAGVREVKKVYTRTVYTNVVYNPGSDGIARPLPGTYSSLQIACETRFSAGIYVITGAFDFNSNAVVTGSDILFVLPNATNISNINSNSNIALSGITKSRLMNTYGYSDAGAAKLAGMLFFDPKSTSQIKWNGNSVSILDGTLYMPGRQLWFNGTSSVTGRCMMLVGRTLMFTGTVDLSSFCQTSGATIPSVRDPVTTTTTTAGTPASVKLVG